MADRIEGNSMPSQVQRIVTFKSTTFNITEPKSYFINECCFGDDLAKWLLGELRRAGHGVDDEPGQEDFGWYLNFEANGVSHCFVLGYRPDDLKEGATWVGELERNCGWLGSILGRRKHGIQSSAVEAIDRVLKGSPSIGDVRWHFREGVDSGGE